jgi:hypothetical protein
MPNDVLRLAETLFERELATEVEPAISGWVRAANLELTDMGCDRATFFATTFGVESNIAQSGMSPDAPRTRRFAMLEMGVVDTQRILHARIFQSIRRVEPVYNSLPR